MRTQGFTLAELLVVILLMAALAATAIPQLSSTEADRLETATAEVKSALRFARNEALQRATPVLVDMETQAHTLKIMLGTCTNPGSPLVDPRTGRPFVLDLTQRSQTQQVGLSAQVLVGSGRTYQGLVFDASGAISEACDVAATKDKGVPQRGSQVVLNVGEQAQSLTLWPVTGRVSGP
ncbi:MAG: GspH/FimT family pseudopilin [Ideonella sp.]|nr:GspH/FimT family pseudopilin [Ideonella sp.]